MRYLLGIDFGGGSSKATLLDTSGNIVAESTAEYPTYYPSLGACEQSPEDWITALCENTRKLLDDTKIDSADIMCIAVDSATHTSVVCDNGFNVLRNAIHWTDSRSRAEADKLREESGNTIFAKTFHSPDTIWTIAHLLWVKNNQPELFKKIGKVFFEKDYIRYFLTGVFCTDFIEAEGSMLFNCNEMKWDSELCSLIGLDINVLPEIKNPTDIIGSVTRAASLATGLYEGTPVICGTTDTCMEVFASGAVETGDITVKLATAGRICIITDKPYPDRHLVNYSHAVDGLWYPGTATKAAASSYRWYRDTFGESYKELDIGAENIPVGCDGLIFHPYINGELTPYADPMLCGSFTGIRATHTKAHFTRAVLEGVALSLLDSKRYLEGLNIPHNDFAVAIGGGTKGRLWRQITSDVLGIALTTNKSSDSSFGSAMLAGVACGVFASPKDAVEHCVKPDTVTHPNLENTAKYSEIFETYKKIHDVLAPIYHEKKI
jgi:xylulokinase